MKLSKNDLNGQFVLTKNLKYVPEKWNIKEKDSWLLATHPSLPITNIYSLDKKLIGWLIGYFISSDGEYLPEKVVFNTSGHLTDSVIESELFSFGGRFIGIFLNENFQRVYLDASGSFPAVYSTQEDVVASTPSLIGYEMDVELLRALNMPQSGLYFPFDFTSQKNVKRLLPNIYLDLQSMTSARHWPLQSDICVVQEDVAIQRLEKILKRHIGAVAKKYRVCIPLTGGKDSRMLLACAKEFLDNADFVTVRSKSESTDTHIVNILAKTIKFNHKFLYRKTATREQLEEWLIRTGYSSSGSAWKDHQTYKGFDYRSVLMPGICGEIGRGFFYRRNDNPTIKFNATQLLERMKIPAYKPLLLEVEKYLHQIKELQFDHFQMLDYVYLEQRLGSWAGPSEIGGDKYTAGKLWPMSHRETISAFLNLPLKCKKDGNYPKVLIQNVWPELVDIPINTFTGKLKVLRNIHSMALRGPSWIKERIRARKYRILNIFAKR